MSQIYSYEYTMSVDNKEDIMHEFIELCNEMYKIIKTENYSNIEWSIGCILKNKEHWYFRVECNEYIFERLNLTNNEQIHDLITTHIMYSIQESTGIEEVFFKSKRWGIKNKKICDDMSMKMYYVLTKFSELYNFEVHYKKKIKSPI